MLETLRTDQVYCDFMAHILQLFTHRVYRE
jgi:hypothetical protein